MIILKYCKRGYNGISGKFWIIKNTKYNTVDVCWSFFDAIRFYLWNLGIASKLVFRKYDKKI